jgi:hypothetical protein
MNRRTTFGGVMALGLLVTLGTAFGPATAAHAIAVCPTGVNGDIQEQSGNDNAAIADEADTDEAAYAEPDDGTTYGYGSSTTQSTASLAATPSATAGYDGYFSPGVDRAHRSTSKVKGVPVPPTASAHGWWINASGPATVAIVNVRLFERSCNNHYVQVASETKTKTPGTGVYHWVPVNRKCTSTQQSWWMAITTVTIPGTSPLATGAKASTPQLIACHV